MIKSAIQINTIGALLRDRRKEKKLTIEQVADSTKIRQEYLQALEQGNYRVFPSEVYLKGFLKNYAKFLDISADRAQAMYRREHEFQNKQPQLGVIDKFKPGWLSDLTITPNKLIALVIVSAIVITFAYIGTYVNNVLQKPRLEITAPTTINTQDEGSYQTTAGTFILEGKTDVGSKLKINGQELKLSNFEKFSEEFTLEAGLNRYTIVAENQFGRQTTKTLKVIKEAVSEISPSLTITPTVVPTIADNSISKILAHIEIVTRDAYIEIAVDNLRQTPKTYKVGRTLDFEASQSFEIYTQRPDAVKLTINGEAQTLTTSRATWKLVNGKIVKQ